MNFKKPMNRFFATFTLALAIFAQDRPSQASEKAPTSHVIKHFVAFRFKDSVTESQRVEVQNRFLALKTNARRNGKNYILSIESGLANSPEGADQGMTQGYIVTFKSAEDRDYYVGKPFFADFDPAHDAFKQLVGPLLDTDDQGKVTGVFVFDFEN